MAIISKRTMACPVLVLAFFLCAAPATAQRKMNTHNQTAPDEQSGIKIGRFHVAASYGRLIGHPDWYFYSPWIPWGAYPFGYPSSHRPFSLRTLGIELQSGMGEVSLQSNVESAAVFIDGAYAGKAGDLATLWLEQGAYDFEVVADEYQLFRLRVFVLLGKRLNIDAQLVPIG